MGVQAERREAIGDALEAVRLAAGGTLHPEDVVTAAEPVDSILHGQFNWDNTTAAHEHRLWQARQLIRVRVSITDDTQDEFRVYVSLEPDRGEFGYRTMVDVMQDPEMREQLLAQARRDMNKFRRKYQQLERLAPVLAAMAGFE